MKVESQLIKIKTNFRKSFKS